MRRPRLLLAGAALTVLVVGWLVTSPWAESDPDRGVSAPAGEASAPDSVTPVARDMGTLWPAGQALVYSGEFRQTGSAALGQGDAEGSLHLQGELSVARVLDGEPDWLVLEWTALSRVRWSALGEAVDEAAARAMFIGHQAYVRLDTAGAVTEISFSDGASRPFARVMETFVRQVLPEDGAQPTWRGPRLTGLGEATTAWTRSCERERCTVASERAATDYLRQTLATGREWNGALGEGRGTFTVVGGRLQDASTTERLHVLNGRTTLAATDLAASLRLLRSVARREAVVGRQLTFAELPDLAAQRALDGRVRGMTFEQIRADLLQFGEGGVMPDHKRWLWRATGWLKRYPERTGELALLFENDRLGARGQALVLDLLANVGHGPAQQAMRGIFAAPDFPARSDAPALVQRAALLRQPESASVTQLVDAVDAHRGTEYGRAATIALGAAAGRTDQAGTITQRLAGELSSTERPADRRALLRALGNTHASGAEASIASALTDAHPAVRAEAARALRRIDSASARAALGQMVVAESHPMTQKHALVALGQADPAGAVSLQTLSTLVNSNRLNEANVYEALEILQSLEKSLGAQQVWPVAEQLQAARLGDKVARNRVRSYVQTLSARL